MLMLGRSGRRFSIPEGVGWAPSSSTGTGTTYRRDCVGEAKGGQVEAVWSQWVMQHAVGGWPHA